jgi:hypothetical protein
MPALLQRLGAAAPAVTSYSSWCSAALPQLPVEPEHGRAVLGRSSALLLNCDWVPAFVNESSASYVGDFLFPSQLAPAGSSEQLLQLLQAESSVPLIFLHLLTRHKLPRTVPAGSHAATLPINRWHHQGVQLFLEAQLGAAALQSAAVTGLPPPFAAFHWRSEHVEAGRLEGCAANLSAAAHRGLPRYFSAGGEEASATEPAARALPALAVLLADMPSPLNPVSMWGDYVDGAEPSRHSAMARLLSSGFIKYDDWVLRRRQEQLVDPGVLALRDYLLALKARLYVSCQGDFLHDCRQCFRSGSNFISRIARDRLQEGLPVSLDWFQLQQEELLLEGTGYVHSKCAGSRACAEAMGISRAAA